MPALGEPGPRARLLVVQHRQHAEDDGHARVEPDPHQPVHRGLGNVLEVHCLALDQHAHGDDGVEGPVGLRRGREGREVRRRGPEEVARRDGAPAARALDLRRREESVGGGAALECGVMQAGEGCRREAGAYLWTAVGSSHEPGTVWVTMFASLTPHSRSFSLAPCTSGSMMVSFHRAWTMATRSEEPSYFCGAGPLVADMSGGLRWLFARRRGYVGVWVLNLVLVSVCVRRWLSMVGEGERCSAGDASLRGAKAG